jgi:hypothetical protein
LAAVGAELTGEGSVTFDYEQPSPLGAGPRPVGRVSLTLNGGNALLDNLVQIGLIPQEQALGFRMMLGLFARPVEGADTLSSTIEMTPEGGLFANGQRLQ